MVSKGPKTSTVPDVTTPVAERRAGDAEGLGLRREDRQPAGHRPEPGRHRADPGSARRIAAAAGHDRDDRRRQVRRDATPDPAVTCEPAEGRDPRRRAVLRARDLARLRPLGARIARSRRRTTSSPSRSAVTDAGSSARGDGSVAETLPVPAANAPATLGAVDVVLPILHGPVRRGRDGAGAARARGRAVCRRRRGGVRALHGQGPVQEGAARQRDSGRAPHRASRGR